MASIHPPNALRVIEPDNVPEFFVTGLAGFEIMPGLIRLAYSCERTLLFEQNGISMPVTASPIVRVRLAMPFGRERSINRQIAELIEIERTLPM